MLPAGSWERTGGPVALQALSTIGRGVVRGEHQEPEEAHSHQRQARRAQQGRASSELKTRVKNADQLDRRATTTTRHVRLAVKRIDMAAAKGIIHPNQAARRKSRLMKKVNAG